jgi:hypothetical protein
MQRECPESTVEGSESFEPLRVGFAVVALLLGLAAGLHF